MVSTCNGFGSNWASWNLTKLENAKSMASTVSFDNSAGVSVNGPWITTSSNLTPSNFSVSSLIALSPLFLTFSIIGLTSLAILSEERIGLFSKVFLCSVEIVAAS